MKKNRIVALLVTVIAFMGLWACQDPLTPSRSSGSEFCTVSFDKNSGDSADIIKIQVEKGKTTGSKHPEEPSREGYQFDGWYDESVYPHEKYEADTKITKNLDLKALWKGLTHTVTFDKNASDATEASPSAKTVTVPATTIDALPASPERAGYGFAGWNTQADGLGTAFVQTTPVSANITVYARWIIGTETETTYTVTFNKNAADATEASPSAKTVTVPATTIDALPTAPERAGYGFTGWNSQADGSGTAFVQITPVSANITVYARWAANTLSISYDNGGGTGSAPTSPSVANYGTNVTMPANPYTKTGYTFAGWEVSGTGSLTGTYAAGASVAVTALSTAITNGNAGITLTATWTINQSSNANIRAVSSGASGSASAPTGTFGLYIGGIPATDNGTPGTSATSLTGTTAPAPTKNGTIGVNTTTGASGSTVVVIVEDAAVSKVEFGRNGAADDTTAPTWQTLIKTNDNATPSSLTNKRWVGTLAQANTTNNWRFWVRITAEDGTTTRVYRYTATISTNNPAYSTLTSLSIGGQTLTGTARGTVAGWWNNTVAPSLAAGEVTLTSGNNVAIAATWTVGTGGTITYHYAIIPHTITMPLKEGDFTGTFTSENPASISGLNNGDYILLRVQYNSNNIPILGHCLIKVNIQSAIAYTVTFDKNNTDSGSTNANPTTKTVTAPATTIDALPTAPTRTGYTFNGWNTQANGSGTAFVQTTPVSANITVYAQWTVSLTQSSNANIRAVSSGASGSASAPTGTFGLYIGGIPATDNGTPGTSATSLTGTTAPAPTKNGTIGVNTTTGALGSSIVVIVEDAAVSKVEFGRTNVTNDNTAPGSWQNLTKTNDANTPSSLTNKRWVGTLAQANTTNNWRFWVRITAEDGTTTRVYRYTATISTNNPAYSTLTSLSIGGQTLTGTARGTVAGWWNNTVAPSLAAGEVTLTSGNNVAIAATWTVGTGGTITYHYAIIPHTITMPLKEGDFTGTFISGNPTTLSGLNNGDYILLRAQYTSSSIPILGHCLIKVNCAPPTPTWGVTVGPGTSYTFLKLVPGYSQQSYRTVTLSNSGNQPTGNLTVSLTGTNSASFEFDSATANTVISSLAASGLTVGQSANLQVRPKTGLALGSYSAAISVSGGNGISASYPISVTVSNQPPPSYIGATADAHYGPDSSGKVGVKVLNSWMTKLQTYYPHLDYMLFCGDNGSAYQTGIPFWSNVATLINIADNFVPGFVGENIFITGNHEWQNSGGGALLDNLNSTLTTAVPPFTTVRQVAERLNYDNQAQVATASNYVIYTFGPKEASTPASSFQGFTTANRTALSTYLASAPTDIPIIILTHFPLHRYPATGTSSRISEYASDVIDILNQHPNVVFLWGHNHSNRDPMYQSIKGPGYTMSTTSGTSTTAVNKNINFLYVPAGCMSDTEYNTESADIYNKGVILEIDNNQLTFTYYDKDCNVTNKSGWESTAVYNLTNNGYVKQ